MSSKQKGLFKAVSRINDMEKDMYRDIEKIAKDCVESTKEKFKNENDIANFLKKQLEEKYILCWPNWFSCFCYS